MIRTNKTIIVALVIASTMAFSTVSFASGPGGSAPALSDMAEKAKGMAETGNVKGAMDAININTASLDALKSIPGLDPRIGEAIAAYREANGAFKSLSDLLNIDGITPSLLEKLKPLLAI